ncbi:MAG: DUF4159 domain-containing protein [Planctomycetota bacterium]|nr:DUF4159 domain-containing protein [Planctomycetota bacterium]
MEEKQRTCGTRIVAAVNNVLYCLEGSTGGIVWSFDAKQTITSSPAVGDVDGDGGCEAVLGTMDGQIYAVDVSSGQSKWTAKVGGAVYSSPALARKEGGAAFRKEWPMFRHDPARTGFYGHVVGPLDIYFCCDDGGVYLLSGRDGRIVDKHVIKFPPLLAPAGAPHEARSALPFISSPSVADLDGDGRLEIVFSAVDRVWCLTNRASGRNDTAADGDNRTKPGSPIAAARFVRRDHTPGFSSFLWAQIIHRGDWGPDERTYPALLNELARRVNLDTISAKTNVSLLDKDIAMYPFLYMTGHYSPGLSDEEITNLREHLKRGGFLFADACCGSEKSDVAFRQLAVQLFPQSNLERIPLSHELFGCFYKIDRAKYHGVPEGEPSLEGITIDDRLVIVYSKYDLGCAWANPPCSKACKGGDHESSLKITTNVVVYALTK